jgi:hypothetical protein
VHPHRSGGQFAGVAMHVFSVGAPNCMFTSQNGFAGSFFMQSASELHTSGLCRRHAPTITTIATKSIRFIVMSILSDDRAKSFVFRRPLKSLERREPP